MSPSSPRGDPLTDARIEDLLDRNADHVEAIDDDRYADLKDGQAPPVVSLTCSDSRVPQEGMFSVDEPGSLFTPSNIGNQARVDGPDGIHVDGSLLYPLVHTGTRTAVVVGHTGCGAVTAACEAVRGERDLDREPPGTRRMVAQLVPVVEEALAELGPDATVDDVVERNVDAQVAFLRSRPEVPEGTTVAGMVYDLHGSYGGPDGAAYLVNVDGETRTDVLREGLPERLADRVRRRTDP